MVRLHSPLPTLNQMKKKALIIFKAKWDWNKFIIQKISNFYDVEHIYLDRIKKNYLETIKEINFLIEKDNIDTVFFDVDYQKFINFYFIKKIKKVKKVMMCMDNYERHNINMLTACACDVVLTDVISVLKYKEVGKKAFNWFIEADGNFYKETQIDKSIDVLFFGKINDARKDYIDFIEKNGIKLRIVGNNPNNIVSDEKLVELICKSKIVINFSKTTWDKINNIPEKNLFFNQYQLKGRIVQVGLCGTACISEYAPHHELLYNSNELFQFKNKQECLSLLQNLLNNSKKLQEYTKIFSSKTRNFYEEKKEFDKIFNFLEKLETIKLSEQDNLNKIPYWYNRICAKQILLRDLKITRFFSSIINFKELFYIAKKSDILEFILIFIESVFNFIYYSLINTIRTKSIGKNRYTDKL